MVGLPFPRGLALSACLALAACRSADPERPSGPPPVAARASASAPAPAGASPSIAHVELVTAGAAASAELPLVIALHGLGDAPAGYAELFAGFEVPARIAVLQAPDRWGDGYAWFSSAGDDREATAAGIRRAAGQVAQSIRTISRQRPTRGRAIVTGFSQGGALSFALAAWHSDLVRVALPIGGWLPSALHPGAAPAHKTRVFALHGAEDVRIPPSLGRDAVDALRSAGYPAELEVFADTGHQIPAPMRARLHALLAAACREASSG